jgi:tetraacyldisaccharide 4'-kinase
MNGVDYIRSTMYDSRKRNFLLNLLSPLFMISKVHGLVVALRRALYRIGLFRSRAIDSVVISVGNIVVGGTGKTPTVVYLARLLKDNGYRVCVLSRGYKGTNSEAYHEVSDESGVLSDPKTAGDEPYMMAKMLPGVPVIVGKNRYVSGMHAVKKFKPDVCILDDGFQHLKLKRDLDIVTFDGDFGIGNGHLIPRGILREQASALKRADIVLINKGDKRAGEIISLTEKYKGNGISIFSSRYEPSGITSITGEKEKAGFISGKRVFVFSALANARSFHKMIEQSGAVISGKLEYDDHHYFDAGDYDRIIDGAKSSNADLVLATEKDLVKFNKEWVKGGKIKVYSLDIALRPLPLTEAVK